MASRVWLSLIAVFSLAVSCVSGVPAHAVTIDWVTVENAGNANDPATGGVYGGVAYDYRIGKYEVTIGQYTAFLNAVASTDTYSLYNGSMATDLNIAGISQTGTSGAYSYSVIAASGSAPYGGVSGSNRPITNVSWWDSARFANWMANGQPTGAQNSTTTENGAYNINGATSGTAPAKNVTNPNTSAAPTFFIPTENEWYKAAYYSPVLNSGSGGYYTYATQSDSAPGSIIGSGTNQANYLINNTFSVTQMAGVYDATQNYLTDVGAFTNSASFYGTFDQTGNAFELNDLDGIPGSSRGSRGGSWGYSFGMSSSTRYTEPTSAEYGSDGFRLASPVAVPEPSTWVMGAVGLACGGWQMFRRRKRA
jgi:sulfatase modifying factor 1